MGANKTDFYRQIVEVDLNNQAVFVAYDLGRQTCQISKKQSALITTNIPEFPKYPKQKDH